MAEGLTFGLQRSALRRQHPKRSQQLTVAVTPLIMGTAKELWPEIDGEISELSGTTHDSGYGVLQLLRNNAAGMKFAVRDTSIRAANFENKRTYLERLNRVLGTFVDANAEYYSGELIEPGLLHLETYAPSTRQAANGFEIAGHFQFPTVRDCSNLAETAQRNMRAVAQVIQFFGYTATRNSVDMIQASVSRTQGVYLSQNANSCFCTLGDEFKQDADTARLSGDNVMGPHEPLIYMVGAMSIILAAP